MLSFLWNTFLQVRGITIRRGWVNKIIIIFLAEDTYHLARPTHSGDKPPQQPHHTSQSACMGPRHWVVPCLLQFLACFLTCEPSSAGAPISLPTILLTILLGGDMLTTGGRRSRTVLASSKSPIGAETTPRFYSTLTVKSEEICCHERLCDDQDDREEEEARVP